MSAPSAGSGSVWRAGLMGAAVQAVLMATPFVGALNNCCCAWVIVTGILSAWFLQADAGRTASAGRCGLAGLVSAFAGALLGVPLAALVGRLAFGVAALQERVDTTMGQMDQMMQGWNAAPGAEEMTEAILRAAVGLDFSAWTVLVMIVSAVVFSFFGLFGGLLGGVLLRRAGTSPPAPPAPMGGVPAPSPGLSPEPPPLAEPPSEGSGSAVDEDPRVDTDAEDDAEEAPDDGPLPLDELPTLPAHLEPEPLDSVPGPSPAGESEPGSEPAGSPPDKPAGS